jgi:hypothetical protein
MAKTIEPENDAYKPQTELKVGRMVSSRANTPDDGAAEALHFFNTFPELRPVGPFADPRNSTIRRFRLEGSDRTGVSFIVAQNITLEAVNEIKHEYYETQLERRSKRSKREKKNARYSREKPKRSEANITSASSAAEVTSAQVTAAETLQQPIGSTAVNTHNGDSLTEMLQALSLQTRRHEQEQVTVADLIVDKWIDDHGLTQDQKRLFLRHVMPLARDRRRGEMTLLSDTIYLKYCEHLLDRIYPLDHSKVTDPLKTERRTQKAENVESVEQVKKSIKELDERVSGELSEIKKLLSNNETRNSAVKTDIVSFQRDTLELVNAARDLAGMPPITGLYELASANASGHSHLCASCENEKRLEEFIEFLKRRGYTVQSPAEVQKQLRKDLEEEKKRVQNLEIRVRKLEIEKQKDERKFDWTPVLLTVIILLFSTILAIQYMHSHKATSNAKEGTSNSSENGL